VLACVSRSYYIYFLRIIGQSMPDPCRVNRLSFLPRLPWRLASAANVQICLNHASWDRNAVAFLLAWKILGARIFWTDDSRTRSGYHGYSRNVPGGIPDLEMPRQNGTIQYQCCLISRNVLDYLVVGCRRLFAIWSRATGKYIYLP
jgi:hypothetical protein